MFTRMKKINKRLRTLRKGSVLKGFFLQKGQTLMDFQSPDLTKGPSLTNFVFQKDGPYCIEAERSDLNRVFPSSKLSPGLSNQPKLPIYLFWQSQSQIANLSPIL